MYREFFSDVMSLDLYLEKNFNFWTNNTNESLK